MATATRTVVGDAAPEYAGAVGGLKQTAADIGPALGIAVAASTGRRRIGENRVAVPGRGHDPRLGSSGTAARDRETRAAGRPRGG